MGRFRIAEALGEKPGNLLPNDLGKIGHLKPLIDRLAGLRPEFLARMGSIVDKVADRRKSQPPPCDRHRLTQPGGDR